MTIYVGIDPGANGGIATLDDAGRVGAQPLTVAVLASVMRNYAAWDERADWPQPIVGVELVHAMPGQGVTSMFSFGQRYGEVLGVLAAFGITPTLVPPQVWQAVVLLKGFDKTTLRGTKVASIGYCQQQFPSLNLIPPGKRVPHDGMADALCIAEYMRLRG